MQETDERKVENNSSTSETAEGHPTKNNKVINTWKVQLISALLCLAACALLVWGAVSESDRANVEFTERLANTVADRYSALNAKEQELRNVVMDFFNSEMVVISSIFSDNNLQNYSMQDRIDAVNLVEQIRKDSNSRNLYVCDKNGKVYLASSPDWLDTNLITEKQKFAPEEFQRMIDWADQEENQGIDADVEDMIVNLKDDNEKICICKRILDSSGKPTDYYLIEVFSRAQLTEAVESSSEKTVLLNTLSEMNPNRDILILNVDVETGAVQTLYDSMELPADTEIDILVDELDQLDTESEDGTWCTIRFRTPEGERTINERPAYVNILSGNLLDNEEIAIAVLDRENRNWTDMASENGALVWCVILFCAFVLVYGIWYSYSLHRRRTRSFRGLAGCVALLMAIFFSLTAYYLQSIKDVTDSVRQADRVYQQIETNYSDNNADVNAAVFKYEETIRNEISMIVSGVDFSGNLLNKAEKTQIYFKKSDDGGTVPVLDKNGNAVVCCAGADYLKNKTGILNRGKIWIVNEMGLAVASSDSTYWSLDINGWEDEQWIRKVLYRQLPFVELLMPSEDGDEEYWLCVYPLQLYVTNDENGNRVFLSERQYRDAMERISAAEQETGTEKSTAVIPEKQMGVIVVQMPTGGKIYNTLNQTGENNIESLLSLYQFSYAMLEKNEDGKYAVKNTIQGANPDLDLHELDIPDGIKDNTVFSHFQRISLENCLVRTTKNASKGTAGSVVSKTSAVYEDLLRMTAMYSLVFALTILAVYLLYSAEEKKLGSSAAKGNNEINAGEWIRGSELTRPIGQVLDQYIGRNHPRKQMVMQLMIQLILLIVFWCLAGELYSFNSTTGTGLLEDIYSSSWERCINAYNLVAAFGLLFLIIRSFHCIKTVAELLFDPMGQRLKTYATICVSAVQYLLVIACLFYEAYLLGIDLKGVGTFAAIIAAAIGLGANAMIGDIVAGFGMFTDGRYVIGDMVQIKDFKGKISKIGVRTCSIVDEEGKVMHMANSNMNGVVLLQRASQSESDGCENNDGNHSDGQNKESAVQSPPQNNQNGEPGNNQNGEPGSGDKTRDK